MPGDHIQSEAAFEAAFKKAMAASPDAAALLGVSAYLAGRRIPIELIAPAAMAAGAARSALDALVGQRLASPDTLDGGGTGFSVTPAVQEMARARLARTGEEDGFIARATTLLIDTHPSGAAAADTRAWPKCERLARHVDAVLAFAPDTGEGAAATSELLHRVAHYLFARGRYEEATAVVQRSGAIDEIVHGPEDEIVGQGQANLAILLHELGRTEEALPHIRRAMEIGESNLGPQHPIVAERYNILATLLEELKRPEHADPFIRHALLAAEQVLGPDHPDTKLYRQNYERIIAAVDSMARKDDAVEAGLVPAPPERLARHDIPPPSVSGNRGALARLLRRKKV